MYILSKVINMEKYEHNMVWCPECKRSYVAPYGQTMDICPACHGKLVYHHHVNWDTQIVKPIYAGMGYQR